MAYLPDHEPALGGSRLSARPDWTSGHALAEGVDLLIHDAQYSDAEYAERVGWGHSALSHAFQFAALAGIKRLVPFHHDPAHDDETLDEMLAHEVDRARPSFEIGPVGEGAVFDLG
jgi:ribonuclease BN (tRNA processing enzyme)